MPQGAPEQVSPLADLDFAESEMQVALMLADVSLKAYKVGRLRRACDTRSKAETLCSKAAGRLRLLESGHPAELMLHELLDKLALLPQVSFQTSAAG